MTDCERVRPLLFPYIEREAAPAEAMLVADHLTGCTACKILIARKRRLARMLDRGLEDRIPVGEEFVRSVMATLPEGPPPRPDKVGRRRHLRIAGTLGVLAGLAPAVAARLPGVTTGPGSIWCGLDPQSGSAAYDNLLDVARGAVVAVAGWLSGAPFDLSLVLPVIPAATLAAVAFGALAVSSGLLAFAAGSILGSRRT